MPYLPANTPGSGKALLDRVEDSLLPLINLVFLLLMFFIVAGQMSETSLPDLPGMRGKEQPDAPRADLIVRPPGDWSVGGRRVTKATLASRLPSPESGVPLRVAASEAVSMAELETLFRILEEADHTDILLLTEPSQ
ncbi:ExbD/TolR family protein [Marinobacter sp.]|uniref:ExbD/TolR family protein n=1 Tax=Marinobacter sp. TaxID=50741 RepID=UPI00384FDF61